MNILKDKVVVVVGASSGIGESISRYFAQQGSKVYAYARRVELLEQIAREESCHNFYYGKCDAMNNSDITAILDRVVNEQGGVDVWINCVGQNKAIGKTWEISVDDIWDEVEVDLKSCIAGTHTALQYMIEVDKGVIINFCGGGTDKPHLYASGYSAAKTAIARFNESVHLELVEEGSRVKIFGIQPGLVLNERTKRLCTDENSRKYMPEIETAFKEGRHVDPLRTAYFVEFALQGVMDNLSGKVIVPGNLERMVEMAQKNENPENGFVRVKR